MLEFINGKERGKSEKKRKKKNISDFPTFRAMGAQVTFIIMITCFSFTGLCGIACYDKKLHANRGNMVIMKMRAKLKNIRAHLKRVFF